MNEDLKRGAACTGGGAVVGAIGQVALGNIGVAASGAAVAVTLGWFVGIGAAVGAAAYAIYWYGKRSRPEQ